MNVLAAGEILWDVLVNAEYLGGATFNFAAHARTWIATASLSMP